MVLTASGDGVEYADQMSIRTFSTYREADEYIKQVNAPNEDRWTVSEIITEGQDFYVFAGEIRLI